TPGHNVQAHINEALQAWAGANMKTVRYIQKGENNRCEMYSCFKAEVPLPEDPSTGLNKLLVEELRNGDPVVGGGGRVLIAGQALSHCVNHSARDLAAAWPAGRMADLCLLADCTSPVPGFDAAAEAFVADMRAVGVTVTDSASVLAAS
ncbi:unnamed protein product, partial [Phaeothamnion confervicola]